jgi:hypothetical protein
MPLTTASGGTADASIFTRHRTPGGGHDPLRAITNDRIAVVIHSGYRPTSCEMPLSRPSDTRESMKT